LKRSLKYCGIFLRIDGVKWFEWGLKLILQLQYIVIKVSPLPSVGACGDVQKAREVLS